MKRKRRYLDCGKYEKFIVCKGKKVNFVRVRDIIAQHFSRRKMAEQPKKVNYFSKNLRV